MTSLSLTLTQTHTLTLPLANPHGLLVLIAQREYREGLLG
jgi:hypothetical protein